MTKNKKDSHSVFFEKIMDKIDCEEFDFLSEDEGDFFQKLKKIADKYNLIIPVSVRKKMEAQKDSEYLFPEWKKLESKST